MIAAAKTYRHRHDGSTDKQQQQGYDSSSPEIPPQTLRKQHGQIAVTEMIPTAQKCLQPESLRKRHGQIEATEN